MLHNAVCQEFKTQIAIVVGINCTKTADKTCIRTVKLVLKITGSMITNLLIVSLSVDNHIVVFNTAVHYRAQIAGRIAAPFQITQPFESFARNLDTVRNNVCSVRKVYHHTIGILNTRSRNHIGCHIFSFENVIGLKFLRFSAILHIERNSLD